MGVVILWTNAFTRSSVYATKIIMFVVIVRIKLKKGDQHEVGCVMRAGVRRRPCNVSAKVAIRAVMVRV